LSEESKYYSELSSDTRGPHSLASFDSCGSSIESKTRFEKGDRTSPCSSDIGERGCRILFGFACIKNGFVIKRTSI